MGCDIHMVAEIKTKPGWGSNPTWEPMLDAIFKDRYFKKSDGVSRWNAPFTFQPYDDRNYTVFSVLANVRNGRGVETITEPRGYPEDMHEVTKYLLDGYDFADHSFTWLSLDEVLNYDWKKLYKEQPDVKVGCEAFLKNMKLLKEYATDEVEVRLVFGFDS